MSAPAGLAVSKIICPETEESKTETWEQIKEIEKIRPRTENIIEAAAKGAQDAVILVMFVGATIIAFLAILDFLNAVLVYLGSLVNIENLTFDVIISYPLMPMAFLMGVSWNDCQKVGEVIGLKTIMNELIGYQRLGKYIAARQISKRSEVIATYALCGFSNPITIGVMLGGLGALIPGKKPLLSKIVIRAWIAGSIACFMTACFAGLFFDESDYEPVTNGTFVNQAVIK
ncbi:hypothetical protein CHS0354_007552 [Potamilus streckersoni]|uniref:Concentrative nucleoside transporter C-terminal domain-containing protein n=1 Tax=Potamilus streckersoni TaxID=2493646 RepID=A0AAE0W6U1_9BIVA|nr:hypothetical protein CHS0354_007552 [Potamilus streckersoni]